MATYFVSFCIEDDSSYQTRYDGLVGLIGLLTETTRWEQTTSFILFDSSLSIDAISKEIKAVIRPSTDTVVLGKPAFQAMRVIGLNNDEDIYKLVPFAKKG